MNSIASFGTSLIFASCYTMNQGVEQARLLMKREPIEQVLEEKTESADRLELLSQVPQILEFCKRELGLKTGKSYQTYVSLDRDALTYVVQAAPKRELKLKTWWFPLVGSQPYLGFFQKKDAEAFQKKLVSQNFDTTLGGVQAFSLLGYFADPIYSTMVDRKTLPDFVELLIHESVHQTLYIPDLSQFNESFAEFVALKGTVAYFNKYPVQGFSEQKLLSKYEKKQAVQKKLNAYLQFLKKDLEQFYERSKNLPEETFLKARMEKFEQVSEEYPKFMGGVEKGTGYEFLFQKGRINNALILGLNLYEANPKPFEIALGHAKGKIPLLISNLEACLNVRNVTEETVWNLIEQCRGKES